MSSYLSLIEQFVFTQAPTAAVAAPVRFEAIFDAIIGTRQLRFGPKPSPEVQVGIRDVLRSERDSLTFFIPWASRKQEAHAPLDILEFCALTQLRKLQQTLKSFNVKTSFVFRLEDLTDSYLFAEGQHVSELDSQIRQYRDSLTCVAEHVLDNVTVKYESDFVSLPDFHAAADVATRELANHFNGGPTPTGMRASFSPVQLNHFMDLYRRLFPTESDSQRLHRLAQYFGCVFARRNTKATAVPEVPHLFVTFSHPVPQDPVRNNRLYYRTLPATYTNMHNSPWMTCGYLQISEAENEVTPKFVTADVVKTLTPGEIEWNGIRLNVNYLVTD